MNGQPTPTVGWIDDVSTDYAEGFIRDHQAQPFLLVLGFKTCHGPFEPPPRHAETYAGEQARAVPNLAVPAIYRQGEPPGKQAASNEPAATDRVKTNLGMFRGITAIDENVGRLLKLLDDLQLADDTMVVFASDNGYYLGEHGLGDKRSAYEESLRIPLLVRYPRLGRKGQLVDQIALNIDLAPTLLDFAGVTVPKEMHGRSWRPLLEGRTPADWRTVVLLLLLLRAGLCDPDGDRRPHRNGETHQVPRPRRVDRGVRPEERPVRDQESGQRSGVRGTQVATGGRIPAAVGCDLVPHPTVGRRSAAAGRTGSEREEKEETKAVTRLRQGRAWRGQTTCPFSPKELCR